MEQDSSKDLLDHFFCVGRPAPAGDGALFTSRDRFIATLRDAGGDPRPRRDVALGQAEPGVSAPVPA